MGDVIDPVPGPPAIPLWLPQLLVVQPWTTETYNGLYTTFCQEIKAHALMLDGLPVWFFPETEDGRERIFWHLTSRDDDKTGDRIPDLRRCERMHWVRYILANAHASEVIKWDYREPDKTVKTYLWLKDHSFVVILKKYPDGSRRLITSFWVDYQSKVRDLESKWKRREK